MKTCSICKIDKDLEDFYPRSKKDTAKKSKCKKCSNLIRAEYKRRKPKPIKEKKIITNKQCLVCKTIKESTEFRKKKDNTCGFGSTCKECLNTKRREEYKNNSKKFKERSKEYRDNNKEKVYKAKQIYLQKNIERYREYRKNYSKTNRKRLTESDTKRRRNDISYRITCCLRGRIKKVLRRGDKSAKTMELIGCNIEFFKSYIESLFEVGMSWDNYGFYGWHIDHIRPCASFDLTDPEQQRVCFHYTNLRPLWAKENLSRSKKWDGYSSENITPSAAPHIHLTITPSVSLDKNLTEPSPQPALTPPV